ncbi:MAG: chemotaxis protein CheX [Desulfuromonas sp.]|nr:MAG: chemotaxis protein CheX [Desulfuromonas sp.]
MDLEQMTIDSTQEVFETMIMLEVTPQPPLPVLVSNFTDSVSGMVGLAGGCKGLIAIHAPDDVAMDITGRFLGMVVEEINEDVTDAFGELANMLAGNVKMVLDESGKDITLSVPSYVYGADYHVECTAEAYWVMIPFESDAGEFLVQLQIEKA